jgi:AcrR family transcriptional regulator
MVKAGVKPDPQRDSGTEQRILDAARTVFLKQGTAGARMQEIAEVAGVNKALLHYYFRSKARLAEAVFVEAARQLLPAVIEVLASPAEIEEKVERVVDIELSHLLKAPFLPGYLISEMHHNPDRPRQLIETFTGLAAREIRLRVLRTLAAQIAERVAAGTLRRVKPEQFVVNLLALCVFPFAARPMVMLLLDLDEQGFQQFIARRRTELVSFFLGALRP